MKYFKCPECKRVGKFKEGIVMKICPACQKIMWVEDDGS